jgi:hypothetical protein
MDSSYRRKTKKEEINVIQTVKGGNSCSEINSVPLLSLEIGYYNKIF